MATNDIQKLVSINFKKIRISRNLTQQDIADKINKLRRSHSDKKKYTPITRATISKYESGKLMISLTMLNDLCQVLNIKLTEIFKDLYTLSNKCSRRCWDKGGFPIEGRYGQSCRQAVPCADLQPF